MINEKVFLPEEKIIYNLRALYESFGYKQYKIKKFEEYEKMLTQNSLYSRKLEGREDEAQG